MSHSLFLAGDSGFSGDALETYAFPDAEAAWFWCVQTSDAIHSGARMQSGVSSKPRPCEAVDIQTVVLRLAAQKALNDKQINVLATYGKRQLRPGKQPDVLLWQQAMNKLTPVLQHKGIVSR